MTKEPTKIKDFDMDFGFEFQEDFTNDLETELEKTREKLTEIHKRFIILLDNLSKNPKSPIIKWPNRVEEIQKYKDIINSIVEGDNEDE